VVRVVVIVALFAAGACALFSDGPPENTCRGDQDCFRAQGEVCNLDRFRCEPGPDGGVDVIDAADGGTDAPFD